MRLIYDQLWSTSIERVRAGQVEIDPVLAHKETDKRRGLTLLFRPGRQVREQVGQLLERLRELEPDQYYYHPDELHVTFLSLFTATEEHAGAMARQEDYLAAAALVANRLAPFLMSFAGVTLSPGAILVQGFTEAKILNAARDELRHDLGSRGLSGSFDERYRLETAHMTVARFQRPLREGAAACAKILEEMRGFDFGEAKIDALELVKCDWYMSREKTECLRTFELGS